MIMSITHARDCLRLLVPRRSAGESPKTERRLSSEFLRFQGFTYARTSKSRDIHQFKTIPFVKKAYGTTAKTLNHSFQGSTKLPTKLATRKRDRNGHAPGAEIPVDESSVLLGRIRGGPSGTAMLRSCRECDGRGGKIQRGGN
jgi:hypothetical protein